MGLHFTEYRKVTPEIRLQLFRILPDDVLPHKDKSCHAAWPALNAFAIHGHSLSFIKIHKNDLIFGIDVALL